MKKKFTLYALGILLSRGISIIIVPIYIGHITTEEFGRIDLINQITNFIVLIACLEISQGLGRYFYDVSDEQRGVYINSAFWFSLFIHLILLSIISFNSHFLSQCVFPFQNDQFQGFLEYNFVNNFWDNFGV